MRLHSSCSITVSHFVSFSTVRFTIRVGSNSRSDAPWPRRPLSGKVQIAQRRPQANPSAALAGRVSALDSMNERRGISDRTIHAGRSVAFPSDYALVSEAISGIFPCSFYGQRRTSALSGNPSVSGSFRISPSSGTTLTLLSYLSLSTPLYRQQALGHWE